MIYKTCLIVFWKKEVMLPHPVCIKYLVKFKVVLLFHHIHIAIKIWFRLTLMVDNVIFFIYIRWHNFCIYIVWRIFISELSYRLNTFVIERHFDKMSAISNDNKRHLSVFLRWWNDKRKITVALEREKLCRRISVSVEIYIPKRSLTSLINIPKRCGEVEHSGLYVALAKS